MSRLSPQQVRDAMLANGSIRPSPFSSAPLHKSPPKDSKTVAIAARKAECKKQGEQK